MTASRRAVLAVFATAALAANAQAQFDPQELRTVPVDQLKVMYLRCDREAAGAVLAPADAAECSMVDEELLARGFDGDFSRLLAWWREERATGRVCTDPRLTPGPEQCDQG